MQARQFYSTENNIGMYCIVTSSSFLFPLFYHSNTSSVSYLVHLKLNYVFCLQLPFEMQSKVASYMRLETNSHHSDSEGSTGGVGVTTTNNYHILPANDDLPPAMCPFPPTAMVNSMRGAGKC